MLPDWILRPVLLAIVAAVMLPLPGLDHEVRAEPERPVMSIAPVTAPEQEHAVRRHRLHAGWLVLLGVEHQLAHRSRGKGPHRVRHARSRRLRGHELPRRDLRGHCVGQAQQAAQDHLFGRWAQPGRRRAAGAGALQRRPAGARHLPAAHHRVRRRAPRLRRRVPRSRRRPRTLPGGRDRAAHGRPRTP